MMTPEQRQSIVTLFDEIRKELLRELNNDTATSHIRRFIMLRAQQDSIIIETLAKLL